MSDTLAAIKQFAAESKSGTPKKEFVPPTPDDFERGTVLCFDQTLSNTGWALLQVRPDGIHVPVCGLISPRVPTGTKGFQWSFTLAPELFHHAAQVVRRVDPVVPVVIEMPAVQGQRTESSLIAANVLCCVLAQMGRDVPNVVSRQRAGTHLVGYQNPDKKTSNAVIDTLVSTHVKPWNEHVRDAVLLGLEYLHRENP
jgi:hypothetical protein